MQRRRFVTGAASIAILAGCAVDDDSSVGTRGTLRLGLSGGAISDTLDPRGFMDWVPINIGYQLMNGLVEIDDAGNPAPELLESWEPQPGATEWIFTVRRDVVFHNGKTLDVEDILYSINLHRGDTPSASRGVLENVTALRKLDEHRIQISLAAADAELPATLSDYRLVVVPAGFTDWAKPIGTGGYRLESFVPGVRCLTRKTGDYWKADRAKVEAIETLVINDNMARINALISGRVDIINRIDGRTADLMKRNRQFQVVRSQTGQYAVLAMDCESQEYRDNHVRLAMKSAIDRPALVRTILNGYGQIGNDQPVPPGHPFYNSALPQHGYDPDKARFHLKQARREGLRATLQVSDAAFSSAVDAAVLVQASAARAGIDLQVKREPADGYWSNVWRKSPFCVSYSDGRNTVDAIFTKAYKSTSSTNDTHWLRPDFDALANQARAELDVVRRKQLYGECQQMINEDCGAVIPMFMDHVSAGTQRVQGWKSSKSYDLMGQRIGEKVWLRD